MTEVVKRYFEAFNAGDIEAMIDCLSDDIAHHVNEGEIRHGKQAFAEFCTHMSLCYDETLSDIVIFQAPEAGRAAAEYIVSGLYLKTDEGLPDAYGQRYRLTAGSFFDVADDKIARVTTRYNLSDWIAQVSSRNDA